jgi:hypothetical protein
VPRDEKNETVLDRDRRMESLIRYLRKVGDSGASPEVTFSAVQIRDSMDELAMLAKEVSSRRMRSQAFSAVEKLQSEFQDEALRADCARVLLAISAGAREATVAEGEATKASALAAPAISSKVAFQAR